MRWRPLCRGVDSRDFRRSPGAPMPSHARGMRAVLLALVLACAHGPAVRSVSGELPSPHRDQDPAGFYLQPSGLADDYPEESHPVEKMRRDLAVVRDAGVRYLRFGI